jgi:hypothetical protein
MMTFELGEVEAQEAGERGREGEREEKGDGEQRRVLTRDCLPVSLYHF